MVNEFKIGDEVEVSIKWVRRHGWVRHTPKDGRGKIVACFSYREGQFYRIDFGRKFFRLNVPPAHLTYTGGPW